MFFSDHHEQFSHLVAAGPAIRSFLQAIAAALGKPSCPKQIRFDGDICQQSSASLAQIAQQIIILREFREESIVDYLNAGICW